MAFTITSANAVLMLGVRGLYDTPQQIQGFAVDDAFTFGDISPNEIQIGVDGLMSSGFTPYAVAMTIMLQASSPSSEFFDTWLATMAAQMEGMPAFGTLRYPSINTEYTLTNGALTSMKPATDAKKVLAPRPFVITWNTIQSAPTA